MIANAEQIQTWLVNYLSKLLEINRDEVDVTAPFDRFGLDSATVVGMTGDLSEFLGVEVDPTLAYDYPTLEKFAAATARQLGAPVGSPSSVPA